MVGISAVFINLVLIAIWIIYRVIIIKKNKNFNKTREIGISLFFIYFLAVLGLTLFKSGTLDLSVDTYFNANLIPIKETIEMFKDNPLGIRYALYNVVGNIILFIPFGFFIPLLFSKSNKLFKVASYGFIFSLIIESLQFFTEFNATDIDDIIFNTLGAFIGILVYRFAFKIVKHKKVFNIVEKITDDSEVNLVKLSVKPLGAMLISLIGIGMFGLYFSTYSESLTNEEMAQKVFRHNEVNTDSLITKELGDYKLFLKDSGDFLEIGSVKKVFSNRYNNKQGIEICKNVNGKYKAQVIQNWNGNKSQEQKQILVVFGKNDKAKNLNVKFKKYDFTENLKENEPFIFAYEINEEINLENEHDSILEDIRNLSEGIKPKNLSIEFLDGNGALCDNIKFDRYVSSDE